MENKLSIVPVASSLAFFGGAVYVICAAALALFPKGSVAFFRLWLHGVQLAEPSLTWGGFFLGLVSFVAASALAGALFAVIYNRCFEHCEKRAWV